MRLVSLTVGVVDYFNEFYARDTTRLRYAESDAIAFHQYCIAASELKEASHHALLVNKDALFSNLESVTAQLAHVRSIDLFIVYLAGHGQRQEGAGGWFCLADARPFQPSLDSNKLDGILRLVDSEMTLLIADFCHAEALTSSLSFFLNLSGTRNRAYIASARENQLAWEDDKLRRSIFSDVLLRALSKDGASGSTSGVLSLEAEIVPYLREQVPLIASKNKGGVGQEPVTGGVNASDLHLPVVASKSLGRPLTVAQTVRSRFRRWIAVSVVVSVFIFGASDLLLYHLAVNASGEIVVRPGLHATYGFIPFNLNKETATGFTLQNIDPRNDLAFRKLDDGSFWGVSTRLDKERQRLWMGQLQPLLKDDDKRLVDALVRGKLPQFDPDNSRPPFEAAIFLATLLGKGMTETASTVYPFDYYGPPACTKDGPGGDSSLSEPSSPVFVADSAWAFLSAPHELKQRAERIKNIIVSYAFRAQYQENTNDNAQIEANVISRELVRLRSADDHAFDELVASLFSSTQGTWCALHSDMSLGILGGPSQSAEAERELDQIFFTRVPHQALESVAQTIAQESILAIGMVRPVNDGTFSLLYSMMQANGGRLLEFPASQMLLELARTQPLPIELRTKVLTQLGPRRYKSDYDPLRAFLILARNFPFLSESEKQRELKWVEREGKGYRLFSEFQEGLGYLALNGITDPTYLDYLEGVLTPASRFRTPAATFRGTEIVAINSDSAIVALGRWAQRAALSEETTARLANIASDRPDLKERDEVLRGLAHQWKFVGSGAAQQVLHDLRKSDFDAVQRQLIVEVAAAGLGAATGDNRAEAVKELLSAWKEETEPELRMAIAMTIAKTLLDQYTIIRELGDLRHRRAN